VIAVSASPATLSPPNGRLVAVTVSGTITDGDNGSGVQASTYQVIDEYGQVRRAAMSLPKRTAAMPSPWGCRPRAGAVIGTVAAIRLRSAPPMMPGTRAPSRPPSLSPASRAGADWV
jgi:hypothetical protein